MNLDEGVTPFIILTLPRTGSTYLRLWLNNHPLVRCHGEVFLRRYPANDGYQHFVKGSLGRRFAASVFGNKLTARLPGNYIVNHLVNLYLDSLFENPLHSAPFTELGKGRQHVPQPAHEEDRAVGFKLMYGQMRDFRSLYRWISRFRVKIILLRRDNLLHMHVSNRVMLERGVAHSSTGEKSETIYLDPTSLIKSIEQYDAEFESICSELSANDVLSVSYEDFFSRYEEVSADLWRFLGVDSCTVEAPQLTKRSHTELKDMVRNADEVFDVLRGTPYERFLDQNARA